MIRTLMNRMKDAARAAVGTAHEGAVVRMKGEWRDTITYEDGTVVEGDWRSNQVQNQNAILLASLMKNLGGKQGILQFAAGEGLPSWDGGSPAQPASDTTLTNEIFRKGISAGEITFRDPNTFVDIEPTPSNVIQVDIVLGTTEANGSLREFGIFGGDATGAADSGDMVNWVIHGRIDKDNTMTITRSIRFTFQVV